MRNESTPLITTSTSFGNFTGTELYLLGIGSLLIGSSIGTGLLFPSPYRLTVALPLAGTGLLLWGISFGLRKIRQNEEQNTEDSGISLRP
jgi:hypothetical protein